jgi:ABC-type transport system involved in cytochrome bd biosynthesis fused ATPase/permease subunit
MIAEIPTIAIEKVTIWQNTSIIPDENFYIINMTSIYGENDTFIAGLMCFVLLAKFSNRSILAGLFFGLILLSIYNAIFILLGLILLVVVLLVLFVSAKRGLEASLAESNYKYSLMGWIQELARGFKTFKISSS